jgi:hypothetical protein
MIRRKNKSEGYSLKVIFLFEFEIINILEIYCYGSHPFRANNFNTHYSIYIRINKPTGP